MKHLIALLLLAFPLHAIDVTDTRLLSDPAVSQTKIAFGYANDLWLANRDGSGVQRLTSHPGVETSPRFSPDGTLVAFTGRYEGNADVYVVPTSGGEPRRLTWHPGNDHVLGFTADGQSVLFTSKREVHTTRFDQLFTVPVGGGAPSKLPIPSAYRAAISPDGKTVAYIPFSEEFRAWKHYRGGTTSRIMLLDLASMQVREVPQPQGHSNDTEPSWIGNALYFISDRNGELNVFRYANGNVEQLTSFTDFPVQHASAGAGAVVLEQAGYIHLMDPNTKEVRRLRIGVATDLAETRPRFAAGAKYVRNYTLSPTGARAAFEYRGEIVTVPAEKGDDRNLTQSVAANDRSPVWSPDGKSIAWFTDETGEYELRIAPQEGRGAVRKIKLTGAGYYERPKWSPDGKMLSYVDNSHTFYVVDVATGTSTKIAQHVLYRPEPILEHNWSPDSKWLAYSRTGQQNIQTIHLWSVADRRSYALTDGLTDAREPVFDPNGKYLYFTASTNAGPTADWFSMSTIDIHRTNSIYLAVLPKGVASPLAKESDEETGTPAPEAPAAPASGAGPQGGTPSGQPVPEARSPKPEAVVIDFTRLAQRIQALPLPPAHYMGLQIATTGQLHYIKRPFGEAFNTSEPGALARFDLTKRKEDVVLEGVNDYELSRDGKRVLLRMKDAWSIADAGDKLDPSKRRLGIDKVEVRVEPRAEWKQIYDEAYRLHRDWFYDPNYHGLDLKANKAKYEQFLPHIAVRQDLTRLLEWFGSELSVGHFYLSEGDTLAEVEAVPGGLLGADYEVANGRYRFKKVYGGLNWNPNLRAPLTEPGVDVVEGEYLLAVEGKDLKAPENLYARFERTAGRFTEITVGPTPDGKGSRTVRVVPIESESSLRSRDWVERNIRYVTEKTNGRVAYVWVPNTADAGHEYFKRYFFPQADREGIIVDERYNGGGLIADYIVDILRRPFLSYSATRYGADLKAPLASIQGPKVMLIDENAGSGGDYLPWSFRKLGLGPLIGRRTWGGLVGILGYPDLMDGGSITSPNFALWTDEGYNIENVGVAPDIDVEVTPADFVAGRDPQLDKAIEVVLQQLAANPATHPKRPPYPVKVGR